MASKHHPDSQLKLRVVSQEKELLDAIVDSITIPTVCGEITILPGHITLFSQIKMGIMTLRQGDEEQFLVVSDGFLDIAPNNEVVTMVDSGKLDRDISLQEAQKAVTAAHETITKTIDQRELMLAEASLRRALLEARVAERTKKTHI